MEIVRYKYAMNGFRHIELYSTAATSSAMSEAIGDELTWYMPLPPSLLDEVVKPPNVELIKSVSIEINEDLETQPHANIDPNLDPEEQKKDGTKSRGGHTFHLSVSKAMGLNNNTRNERTRTKSNTTSNPLFHVDANIEEQAKQDGTMNELRQWDEAQIAWGTLSHALMIYEKYIRAGALLEINISHRIRKIMGKQFTELKALYMDNHQELISGKLEDIMSGSNRFSDNVRIFSKYPEKRKQLEIIFDSTCKQIESLMNDSYLRFRSTHTYHRLLKQLIKNQRKKEKKDNFLSKTSSQLYVIKDKLTAKKSNL